MTNEELFDAYRQVVSERDQLRVAGDKLWGELARRDGIDDRAVLPYMRDWRELRGIGNEPPLEDWAEC